MKVTPAHDKNDYEAGQRHDLPSHQHHRRAGRMNEDAGPVSQGLDRFEARKKIVARSSSGGPARQDGAAHRHRSAHGKAATRVIEPMLSRQWFVKIEPLAKPAIDAVRRRRHPLHAPELGSDVLQLDGEHPRLDDLAPALVGPSHPGVPLRERPHAPCRMRRPDGLPAVRRDASSTQETDVLDTWFSSGLWPFSTLGWPDETPGPRRVLSDRRAHHRLRHPLLLGGADDHVRACASPASAVQQVFLNGLVRDEHGQKMSKTKGNVIDPLDVIDEFGADAVRFTLAIFALRPRHPAGESRMQGYAAFANKIWNASRFAHDAHRRGAERAGPIDRDELKHRRALDPLAAQRRRRAR